MRGFGLFAQLSCPPQPRSLDPSGPHPGFPRLGSRLQTSIIGTETSIGEGPATDQHRRRQILAKHPANPDAMFIAVLLLRDAGLPGPGPASAEAGPWRRRSSHIRL